MPKHPDTERRILRAFGLPALGWLALVGLLAAPASAAQSAPVDPDAVDAFVESQMSRHGIPGVALALIEDGRVTYTQGYGDAGEGRPMTADTPMPIASISKSFTAVAVLQMVEQDRIDLDAPVRTYLPWFEVADPGVSQAITIRHLLNQTSGLNELGYNRVLAPDTSLEDGVRDLRHAEAAAAPGERFHYFNPNYATLALVIEKVSGRSYAVVVDKSILGPLSMTRSTADWDAVVGEVAQGHIKQFGFAIPQDPPYRPARTGADNVISTAADLASFLVAVGLPDGSGASLLEEGSFETMHAQPDVDEPGYAMGWELSEYRGEPVGGQRERPDLQQPDGGAHRTGRWLCGADEPGSPDPVEPPDGSRGPLWLAGHALLRRGPAPGVRPLAVLHHPLRLPVAGVARAVSSPLRGLSRLGHRVALPDGGAAGFAHVSAGAGAHRPRLQPDRRGTVLLPPRPHPTGVRFGGRRPRAGQLQAG
ncbi:MAG: serine hydrolase domain-containing protein [Aeromicrobium sp.]